MLEIEVGEGARQADSFHDRKKEVRRSLGPNLGALMGNARDESIRARPGVLLSQIQVMGRFQSDSLGSERTGLS